MALPRNLVYIGLALGAAILGVLAAALLRPGPPAQPQSGVYLDTPRPVAEFALLDHQGREFGAAQLQDQWTLVFAGFTHCPDVCPATLGLLQAVEASLGNLADKLQVVFLTVDPERDTPEVLTSYVGYFSPRFTGITGPVSEIDKLTSSLGIAYTRVPGEQPDAYTMDHSTVLVLLNPRGEVYGYFTPPLNAQLLTADLRNLLSRT